MLRYIPHTNSALTDSNACGPRYAEIVSHHSGDDSEVTDDDNDISIKSRLVLVWRPPNLGAATL